MFWRKKAKSSCSAWIEPKRFEYKEVTDVLVDSNSGGGRALRKFELYNAGDLRLSSKDSDERSWHTLVGMGLPAKHSVHPLFPSMLCDRYSIRQNVFGSRCSLTFYYEAPKDTDASAQAPTDADVRRVSDKTTRRDVSTRSP